MNPRLFFYCEHGALGKKIKLSVFPPMVYNSSLIFKRCFFRSFENV